jgi:hypothetical protein
MSEPRDWVVDNINAGRYLIRKDGTDIARVTDRGLVDAIRETKDRAEAYRTLLALAADLASEVTVFWSKRACECSEAINAIARAEMEKPK